MLTKLRVKLERLFQQCLVPSVIPSELTLDDTLIECFSTLSPKCRDEELEDLIYFILDLYQFHGIRVAIAEIDLV
ncbi:hypothetical protein AX14_010667 [Amanita brunnescens Koide BX004]|nr:hypothetical protein AX14_010667 [Amanita brunnescens Koide BX004]